MTSTPHRVVVAGGGVAGLEALLALRALAGDRVALTLVSPTPDFVYRPLAVAEPFALGRRRKTPLAAAAGTADATFVQAGLDEVDVDDRAVRLSDGESLPYDALILATGAKSEPAFGPAHVFNWDDTSEVEAISDLLRDLRAVELVADELERAGIRVELGAYAELDPGPPHAIVIRPSGRRIETDRILALPRLRGRAPRGIRAETDGFVRVDEHGRVEGAERVWAAGDGIYFPVKFGGLAAEQADAAAADIAADAGAMVERAPFRPVLRGRLITGRGPRYLRYDAAGGGGEGETATHALWWPPGKVNGRYLAPWLAERDEDAVAPHLPRSGGLAVQTDLNREIIAR
jgi:sulfide:quinone oxidoreductase